MGTASRCAKRHPRVSELDAIEVRCIGPSVPLRQHTCVHGPCHRNRDRSTRRSPAISLDLSSRELFSALGKGVRLTTGEFDLLAAFVNNPNQVLSRDQLLDLCRNRKAGPRDRTIDVQVGRLRSKLEDDPKKPTMIKTVRGRGYIFTPEVEWF